jgi:cytochrome c-type biogenesis protein CcmH
MVTFALLAAALTLAAVALVAVPLLRPSGAGIAPASWAALAVAALLVPGAAVLYLCWSNWSWRAAAPADSPQAMVGRLARQLEHDPQNLDGWLMLGRSYTVLQEYPLAVRSFARADRLSGGRNAEALLGEAEALALSDESELDSRAARLIERALLLDPQSGKALFLGGMVAARQGNLPLARARFAALLAMNPPAAVRPLIEQQISVIDERLAAAAGQSAAAPQNGAAAAPAARTLVSVNVSLSPTLAAAAGGGPLFVFVREPGRPGPPLAVKRLESHFPQSVALGPGDSLIPGRALAAGQSVQVVARIARTGSALAVRGDPFGEVSYHVGRDGVVGLVIDRLTP